MKGFSVDEKKFLFTVYYEKGGTAKLLHIVPLALAVNKTHAKQFSAYPFNMATRVRKANCNE